jgi:hypothetical protein
MVYQVGAIEIKDETAPNGVRVGKPKIDATTFRGNRFGCSGDSVLLQRNNEGADFRLLVNSGHGGIYEPQSDGKILIVERAAPFFFELPATRHWKFSSKKLKGKTTLGREITMEFDEAGRCDRDIQTLTITIPITVDSDQACVFAFGIDWAAKVVDANIAFGEFLVAKNAGAGHGGL